MNVVDEVHSMVITLSDLSDSAYVVSDLKSNSNYQFVIESLTVAGVSVTSTTVNVTTSNDNGPNLSPKFIVLIAIGSIFAVCLITVGCFSCLK